MLNLQLSARELTVHHSPNVQRVGILQLSREGGIREILITNRTGKAKYCLRADRGGAAIGARGIRSAVNHGVANFNSSRIAVENNATDLACEELEQLGKFPEVCLGTVNCSGEMTAEISGGIEKFFLIGETNQER